MGDVLGTLILLKLIISFGVEKKTEKNLYQMIHQNLQNLLCRLRAEQALDGQTENRFTVNFGQSKTVISETEMRK